MEVKAGALFEARVIAFPTNLPSGSVGVEILDNEGHVFIARVTSPIEDPVGSGSYVTTLRAPAAPGDYSLYWDFTGSRPIENGWEDLVVDAISWSPPAPTQDGGVGNATTFGQSFQYTHGGGDVIPHFDLPFRFAASGHAVEADQDSIEDVTNCVAAIFRTRHGDRLERPLFGIADPTFALQPLDTESLLEAALSFESRAQLLIEQAPDLFTDMTADLAVLLTPTGGQS